MQYVTTGIKQSLWYSDAIYCFGLIILIETFDESARWKLLCISQEFQVNIDICLNGLPSLLGYNGI